DAPGPRSARLARAGETARPTMLCPAGKSGKITRGRSAPGTKSKGRLDPVGGRPFLLPAQTAAGIMKRNLRRSLGLAFVTATWLVLSAWVVPGDSPLAPVTPASGSSATQEPPPP